MTMQTNWKQHWTDNLDEKCCWVAVTADFYLVWSTRPNFAMSEHCRPGKILPGGEPQSLSWDYHRWYLRLSSKLNSSPLHYMRIPLQIILSIFGYFCFKSVDNRLTHSVPGHWLFYSYYNKIWCPTTMNNCCDEKACLFTKHTKPWIFISSQRRQSVRL